MTEKTGMTGAAHDWLDLRAPFDDTARRHSRALLERAGAALRAGPGAGTGSGAETGPGIGPAPLTVVDIGAGTGNSARWFARNLTPLLGGRSVRWVLLDADAASLRVAARAMPRAATVTAPITRLPEVVATHLAAAARDTPVPARDTPAPGGLLITCSAVLDVLTTADIDAVVDTLARFAGLGLFLLSITEEWRLDPPDPHDEAIREAFAAHQERGGKLGAAGGIALAASARGAGAQVISGASPWRLASPGDRDFITRFLTERLAAATEEDPGLRETGPAWLHERLRQAETGLSVDVDHLDVLVDARRRG